jgi:hypothetical protein
MAAPIISAIEVDPASVPPGGTCTVTIQAHDPDTGSPGKSHRVEGKVSDDKGEIGRLIGTITVDAVPGDTIASYELLDVDGAGLVIEQDGSSPSVFRVTVP